MPTYTVKPGDSWTKIAGMAYGDQRQYLRLMETNAGTHVLTPGMKIQLPSKEKISQLDKPKISERNWALSTKKGGNPRGYNIAGRGGEPSPFGQAMLNMTEAGYDPMSWLMDEQSGGGGGGGRGAQATPPVEIPELTPEERRQIQSGMGNSIYDEDRMNAALGRVRDIELPSPDLEGLDKDKTPRAQDVNWYDEWVKASTQQQASVGMRPGQNDMPREIDPLLYAEAFPDEPIPLHDPMTDDAWLATLSPQERYDIERAREMYLNEDSRMYIPGYDKLREVGRTAAQIATMGLLGASRAAQAWYHNTVDNLSAAITSMGIDTYGQPYFNADEYWEKMGEKSVDPAWIVDIAERLNMPPHEIANMAHKDTQEVLAVADWMGGEHPTQFNPLGDGQVTRNLSAADVEKSMSYFSLQGAGDVFDVARYDLHLNGLDGIQGEDNEIHRNKVYEDMAAKGYLTYDADGNMIFDEAGYLSTLSDADKDMYYLIMGAGDLGEAPSLLDFWPDDVIMSGWYGEYDDPYLGGYGGYGGYGGGQNFKQPIFSPGLTRWDYS